MCGRTLPSSNLQLRNTWEATRRLSMQCTWTIPMWKRLPAPVVHCPRSNARLGCGLADIDRLERAGVLVALGTDSPASAGPIDMFAEMRSMIEQHRAGSGTAEHPDAARALRMATVNAALALGHDDLGAVVAGAQADLMVLETGPVSDPVTALVLGGTPHSVRSTWIAGRKVWDRDRNHAEMVAARNGIRDARSLLSLPVARHASPATAR